MKAEYQGNKGFLQRDSVEHKGYAEVQSTDRREGKERDGASDLLEAILDRDNLNRAYKRVKRNHGAAGIDGMTVEEALPWLKEHREELLQSIREPLFSDSSYGYRPKRSAQQAIQKVKEYAEEGYRYTVSVDLSKYCDTLSHELLMTLLHRQIQDMRVLRLIKKYLKSGVMENGVICKTEEGSPQGGPLSPLLANIYLNEFDREMNSRGVKMVRYADDIVVFAKSKRAAERLLESCRKYLEGRLKLKMNAEKSKVTSIFAQKNFKFLGFCLGKNGNGIYIRAHRRSLNKAKEKLKLLTKRNRGRNVRRVMQEVKVFIRGWIGYFRVANMKRALMSWDEWMRRRFRMYIWKQWKKPKTKVANLRKLGIPADRAYQWGNSRLGYWRIAGSPILKCSITNERLAAAGYFSILNYYESLHSCG